jgi:hypothetical protein
LSDIKEPEPELKLQKAPQESRLGLKEYALLALFMCGAVLATTGYFGDRNGGQAGAPLLSSTQGDHVSMDKRAQIDGYFSGYTASLLPIDPQKDKADFMAFPLMGAALKNQLWLDLEKGDRQITTVTLWDNFDEDGDVVSIESGGVTITVPLSHSPTRVYLPYKTGGSLIVTGLRDGGGGITAAIDTASGSVPLPVMAVGQSIVLPLL